MTNRITIGTKIIGIVGGILVLLVLIGLVSLAKLSNVATVAGEIGSNQMPGVTILTKIGNNVDTYRRSELQCYLKNSQEDLDRYLTRMGKMQEEIKSSLAAYRKRPLADGEKKHLAAFDAAWPLYVASAEKVVALVKTGQLDEAQTQTRGEGKKLYDETHKTLTALHDLNQKEADDGLKGVHAVVTTAQIWIVAIIAAGVVFGLLLGLLAVRSICAPLRRLADDAEQIATGDLSVEIRVDSRDELGHLASSFEKMVNSLRELIGRLADSSSEVSKSSAEMQTNSEQMATGAEEVAAQAVTVATASEEMSATSGDIAQNCMLAAESAKRANDAADHGATVVESSIAVMKRIAERVKSSASTVTELGQKSDQIGAIVDTIQDIADQTNLLALNAAIEAARAGEQGRGFAVVADEVRALAERTTKATKEISEMIKVIQQNTQTAVSVMEEGVTEVHHGTDEAERSGEALRKIQDEINAVNLQVQQIATAAEEQTATTSEITGNMHQITEVVAGSVDKARNTYNTAQHLAKLSEDLQRVVGQFRLSETGNLITWSSSYSVQVSTMDEEHQRLMGIINKLYGAMRAGRGRDAVGSILGDLIEYTKTHFSHEEQLMRESGFPGLDGQKRAHENLISKVSEIQKKFTAGEALSQEVMSFLRDWLSNHIQREDKLYGPHLNSRGIR